MLGEYRQDEVVMGQFVLVSGNVVVNEGDFVVTTLNAFLSARRRKIFKWNV